VYNKKNSKLYKHQMIFILYFLIVYTPYVLSQSADGISDVMPPINPYYKEPPYEKCNCLNNAFTEIITEPYKAEIEQWRIRTAAPEHQKTEASAVCIECELEEKSPIEQTIPWWRELWNMIKKKALFWKTKEDPDLKKELNLEFIPSLAEDTTETSHKKPDFIPENCFLVSHQMQQSSGNKSKFFSCIPRHYDGSEKHCKEDQSGDYKYCEYAIPISCNDVKNSENPKDPSSEKLKCKKLKNYQKRRDNIKKTGCNRGFSEPRRPCANKDYVAMTAMVFDKVTDCLDMDKNLAFSILHHESRFILNSISSQRAFCYGQIRGPAIAEVNSYLAGERKLKTPIADIKSKCPDLWDNHFKKIPTNSKNKIHPGIKACNLTANPYNCMIYSLMYLKIMEYIAEQNVERFNQIHILRKNNNVFIFKDEEEMSHLTDDERAQLKEIKIFKEEEQLTQRLLMTSYNGGPTGAKSSFEAYVDGLKSLLSNPQQRELREQLITSGIDISHFKNNFKTKKPETDDYIRKINNDLNIINKKK